MFHGQGPSIGWHVWLGTIITIIPATLLVAARFYARWKSRVGWKADDWLILAALIVDWAMASLRFYMLVNDGLGYHADTIPVEKLVDYQKAFLAVQITYFTTAVLTKSSILFLYKRIFGISRHFTVSVYITLGLVAGYYVACVTACIAGCRPVSYFWNKEQDGHCFDEVQFFRWNGVSNLLLDVLILGLPMPMVWRLHLKVKQKLALSGIFLLGGFAVLSSVLRIIQFHKSRQSDPTYTTVDSGMWSSIEQSVGIMTACLICLRPIFRSFGWDNSTKDSPAEVGRRPNPYYHTSLGTNANSARSKRMRGARHDDTWQDDYDTEGLVELGDPSHTTTTTIEHDDYSNSFEKPPADGPRSGILRTQIVRQDSSRQDDRLRS